MDNQNEAAAPVVASFGDIAVGRSFNPSGNHNVETFKKEIAMFITDLGQLPKPLGMTDAEAELYNVFTQTALSAALTAQMFAVKAATFKG